MVKRDNEGLYIVTKRLIQQGEITVVKVYVPYVKTQRFKTNGNDSKKR